MKILQLINVRWYNACAHFAVSQAKALADRGHEVMVMADPNSPPARAAIKWGLTTDTSINFSRIALTPVNIVRFSSCVKTTRPSIIIAHRGETHVVAALGVKLSGLKVPVVRYRGDVRYARTSLFSKWINNGFIDAVGVSTEKHMRFYLDNFNINKVKVIYPGVDTSYFKPMPRNKDLVEMAGIKTDDTVVGLVGRLDPIKGHRFFIEAAKIISIEHDKVKFIIAGENVVIQADYLKKMVNLLGLKERFIFFGKVDDIRSVISLIDIGVVASIDSESICRVVLEYMAMGIPVVGTDINQIPEIIKECGIVVSPGDPVKMANAISRLIKDKQLREELGNKSLVEVEDKYTLELLGKNSENYLMEILDGAGQPLS